MTFEKPLPATQLTGPHRLLHALLRTMGFQVEDEVPVRQYRLDCFVRELWMGFEADGKRIHAGVKKQEKDASRDEWIFDNAGIPILRIQTDALQYNLWGIDPKTKEIADDGVAKIILDFIERWGDSIDERKAKGDKWMV